ncbi:hypothetical protein AAW14_09750 [Streptomyces hygroscopicus]|uniref:hypothetical protein n=1 Tax=Streptomyces hygroscopicus TaxID=1912 RepID=UPI00224047C9|nr:hypothetical protein [Streptomyces hygroscopicus]MCW7942318.1 hypothetical protein [Streptomyces hygroscopicus]
MGGPELAVELPSTVEQYGFEVVAGVCGMPWLSARSARARWSFDALWERGRVPHHPRGSYESRAPFDRLTIEER